jgi:hypothetical protein
VSGLNEKDSACGGQVGGAGLLIDYLLLIIWEEWIPVFTGMTRLYCVGFLTPSGAGGLNNKDLVGSFDFAQDKQAPPYISIDYSLGNWCAEHTLHFSRE